MKTIITVQHTESEHHINGCIGAWQDWELTARGREQAFRIGQWLSAAGCDSSWQAFVSPQIRARQTAGEIGRTLGISPVVREELREVNAGEGNGKTREWYRAHEAPRGPGFDPDYRPFPSAETDRELWTRLRPFFADLLALPAENILVISHGTTLSFLHSMLLGQSVEDRGRFRTNGAGGSLSRFTVDDTGRVTAAWINHFID